MKKEPTINTISLSTENDVVNILKHDRIVSIDLQLTPEEEIARKQLNINVESVLGNFLFWGKVNDKDLLKNLELYINTIGKNDAKVSKVISQLLVRIAGHITGYFGTEYAWIETKTFISNKTFVVPRWHVDDKFFKPHTAYKLVWAVKGAQTRFGTTKNLDEFNALTVQEIQAGHGTDENIRVRKSIDSLVDEIHAPRKDTAVLYRSGGKDPFIHSEPHMDENRLFIAVVPGTKEEIGEWFERKRQKDIKKKVENRRWYFNTL